MQARRRSLIHSPSVCSHWPSWLLWVAAGLFLFQVAVHASTPADRNMAEWLDTVLTGRASAAQAIGDVHSDQMADMPDTPAGSPAPGHAPGDRGHAHHAEGLCCMPPAALLPEFWTPPTLPLGRVTLTPPKVIHETQTLLRATARGPPPGRTTNLQAV